MSLKIKSILEESGKYTEITDAEKIFRNRYAIKKLHNQSKSIVFLFNFFFFMVVGNYGNFVFVKTRTRQLAL